MIEDFFFLDEGQVKITAASVGISKKRWTAIKENDMETNNYQELMSKNKFDHLPIIDNNHKVTKYFKSDAPNDYSKINLHEIEFDDLIPLETPIQEVIEKFSIDRTFYFLTFQNSVSGLITIGNLNCRQVQVYFFSKICELERELGYFLNDNLTGELIMKWVEDKINHNEEKCKYRSIIEEYKKLVALDLENKITEHFFFVDFFNIITDFKLYEKFKLSKKQWTSLSSINELRKRIAHPTRSLIDNENTIEKLKDRQKKINNLLFKLRN